MYFATITPDVLAEAFAPAAIIAAILPVAIDTEHWISDGEWIETLIIVAVILINAIVGAIQENNAEKSLDALKKLSTPLAKVLRDGKLITINSNELVPGDIFYIEAGDFIPADAKLISRRKCFNR